MSLTQIQQDAIAKARRGDYSLLDAMELEARLKEPGIAVGYRIGGRLRMLGLAADDEDCGCSTCMDEGTVTCGETGCDEGFVDCTTCADDPDHLVTCKDCEGKGCDNCEEGKLDCPDCEGTGDVECPVCLGDGHVDCADCDGDGIDRDPWTRQVEAVINLNGQRLWTRSSDAPDPTEELEPIALAWAEKILADYRKELATAAQAAPAGTRAGQTSMLPETA
jgi:hypothetical protein